MDSEINSWKDPQKNAFYFKKGSKFRIPVFGRHISISWNSKTKQIAKIQGVQHNTVSNTLLCPAILLCQAKSLSTLTFNIHLFNFPLSACCSCIMLHSTKPLFHFAFMPIHLPKITNFSISNSISWVPLSSTQIHSDQLWLWCLGTITNIKHFTCTQYV